MVCAYNPCALKDKIFIYLTFCGEPNSASYTHILPLVVSHVPRPVNIFLANKISCLLRLFTSNISSRSQN